MVEIIRTDDTTLEELAESIAHLRQYASACRRHPVGLEQAEDTPYAKVHEQINALLTEMDRVRDRPPVAPPANPEQTPGPQQPGPATPQ